MSNWKEHMREHDSFSDSIREKPHQIFDINPYTLVFKNSEVEGTWHLYFDAHAKSGSVWMHLIEGKDRALLIDTGFGIGNLKGLVETLTDKPYDVVNTHFHGDHSAGNSQFEKVFCHNYDVPYLAEQMNDSSGGRFLPQGNFYKEEDIVSLGTYEIVGVDDGYVFELGGNRGIEVIHMPGHAAGGCMLLDTQTGMLFSGDAIVFTPTLILDRFPATNFPLYLTVSSFREGLERFLPRITQVRSLYPGHSILGLNPYFITDMIDCCDAIIANPEGYEYYDYIPSDPGQIMCRGHAMIVYSNSRIK